MKKSKNFILYFKPLILLLYWNIGVHILTIFKLPVRIRLFPNSKLLICNSKIHQFGYRFKKDSVDGNPYLLRLGYEICNILQKQNENILMLDIGSNCGIWSLFTKINPNVKCHCYEANPEMISFIESTVQLNSLKNNVKVFNIGLSDKNGTLTLNIPNSKNHYGLTTFSSEPKRFSKKKSREEKVSVKTLDSIYATTETPIKFIKIDTEGWEFYILKGAIKTIKTHQPTILMEFVEDNILQANVNKTDIKDFFNTLNYNCIYLGSDLLCLPKGFSSF